MSRFVAFGVPSNQQMLPSATSVGNRKRKRKCCNDSIKLHISSLFTLRSVTNNNNNKKKYLEYKTFDIYFEDTGSW